MLGEEPFGLLDSAIFAVKSTVANFCDRKAKLGVDVQNSFQKDLGIFGEEVWALELSV